MPIISYAGGHVELFPDAFKQNFIAIYSAILGEKPANQHATFEDGMHQMQVIHSLFESAGKGCWVSIE